ncbi:MAG: alpha/beta hydrolase-fold protein, partial [Brevinematales bacterium]|nr:alpha/beta hydrolase-fold protein [Brevinematales bacterium]
MTTWIPYADYRPRAPHTVTGTLLALPQVWSPHLQNARDVLVYLPPSYHREPERRYPVLYMHDGQNLFDAHTSFVGEWQVDETLEALSQEGIEAIVVGVFNGGEQRRIEYNPFPSRFGIGKGEAYMRFLVETLKPRIDADFRTLPDRGHTGIIGSSMGGLISLYAFFSFADTFGLAGVMSPAFVISYRDVLKYVAAQPFIGGKLYLDVG